MPIDRKKFLTMAMTLALGGAAGCGPKAAPADPTGGGGGGEATDPTGEAGDPGGVDPAGGTMPAQECVNWDADGECSEWAADEGMYPASECVEWDAADECTAWDEGGDPE